MACPKCGSNGVTEENKAVERPAPGRARMRWRFTCAGCGLSEARWSDDPEIDAWYSRWKWGGVKRAVPEPLAAPREGREICFDCEGKRYCGWCDGQKIFPNGKVCTFCGGTGRCPNCGGAGDLPEGTAAGRP